MRIPSTCILLLILVSILSMQISYAEHGINAYNITITDRYVAATGVCSCSLCQDRYHHTRIFYNLNPATNKHGVLYFEDGPVSWTSPEGLWVAWDTDMDFCLVHGKSHDHRGVYLVPYDGIINGYIVQNGYFTGEKKVQNTTTPEPRHIEYVEIKIQNQKYTIKKDKIEELKNKIKDYTFTNLFHH